MFTLKPLGVAGVAAGAGLALAAVAAIAGDAPRIEKRDITIRLAPSAFADIDANKDGTISPSEFNTFHAENKLPLDEGDLPQPPGGRRMRIMMMEGEGLDANKDGKISFEEFSGPMKAHFDELDANGDGMLDESERPKDRMIERRLRK